MTSLKPSKRIINLVPSKSIALASKVSELKNRGLNIIGLHVGEAEIQTPNSIIKATQEALERGQTRYNLVPGRVDLREKLAHRFQQRTNRQVSAKNVFISHGSKQVLFNIFQSFLDPGDEILIPTPYWVSFPESAKLAGAEPIFFNGLDEITPKTLAQVLSKKTKALIINSPNNPSSKTYSLREWKVIEEFVLENKLLLISDEAYETLSFNGPPIIPASLSEDLFNQTFCVQSFSKSFMMTGFRIGFVIAPRPLIEPLVQFQGHSSGNVASFIQAGALNALENEKEISENFLKFMRERAELAYNKFSPLFQMDKPQGGFYLFPKIPEKYRPEED